MADQEKVARWLDVAEVTTELNKKLSDYDNLNNKPAINNNPIEGNIPVSSTADLSDFPDGTAFNLPLDSAYFFNGNGEWAKINLPEIEEISVDEIEAMFSELGI